MFSKKATKIEEIFTVYLTPYYVHNFKSTVKISSIFVAFLENMNFMADMENFYDNLKIINLYSFQFWIYLLELQWTRAVTFSLQAKFWP